MDIKTAKKVHTLIEDLNYTKECIDEITHNRDYGLVIKSDHGHTFAYITGEDLKNKVFDLLLDELMQRKYSLKQQINEIQ